MPDARRAGDGRAAGSIAARHTALPPLAPLDVSPQVGVIGLGRMGTRMVPRLLDAGHDVVVNDSNKIAVERIREIGAQHPNAS
jgi:D-arabinose 1-dehydrogenase-like Zn-dependent alcohol dehydrogenase